LKSVGYNVVFLVTLFAVYALVSPVVHGQSKITKKNIAFINYPGFPEGKATWDDIGYNSTYKKVFVAVTN
jgi:hypothetical protein